MKAVLTTLICALAMTACGKEEKVTETTSLPGPTAASTTGKTETATLAAGCFWCVEAIFEQQPGVLKVTSGYTGGTVPNPTYEQVCSHGTGHAEATEIVFDPSKTSFEKLLEVFWHAHDPTTLNRQGNDVGDQYRSAIFYHGAEQKKIAEASRDALAKSGAYKDPIVTEIVPAGVFYPAENYHQEYYRLNKGKNPYCQYVIRPKLQKLGLQD